MTRYVGIIGYPLKHSISPLFQQAAFDHLGLDIRYETWETGPEGLRDVVERLRRPENLGANVTIPYKESVMTLLDGLEEPAGGIGAVNVIAKKGPGLIGYNTDVVGFLRALEENGGFRARGGRVVLLGAGGAARAAAMALVRAGVASLTIVNRTLERARGLASHLAPSATGGQRVTALPWDARGLARALSECNLVVNATSIGMKHSASEGRSPLDAGLLPRDALIYDMVYNPKVTPLLEQARKGGSRTLGGLPMLVFQGVAAFELWTGRAAPIDIMFEAAERALES
ncbi:MAG: shikimate dehydrogenase [Dehalococcoidia bacterium]